MKARNLTLIHSLAALMVLAGCSTPPTPSSQGAMMGMGGAGGTGMGGANTAQMCAMHRQMMEGKSPAEQQAAMVAQMRTMQGGGNVTPEQARMHREMMDRNCAAGSTGR